MTTPPTTLYERIRAELARRTAVANAATPGPWTARPYVYGPVEEGWGSPSNFEIVALSGTVVHHYPHEGGGIYGDADAAHIALHDPADALRRYAGELEVLERHWQNGGACEACWRVTSDATEGVPWLCPEIRSLGSGTTTNPCFRSAAAQAAVAGSMTSASTRIPAPCASGRTDHVTTARGCR